MSTCPKCGGMTGIHHSILPGCMCFSSQTPPAPLYTKRKMSTREELGMYTPIPVCSTIWGALYDLALDESSEYVEYYGFDVLQVPDEIIARDKQLAALRERYPFTAGITRMQPYTVYNWHTDDNRHGTINMMIHNENSHCLFTTNAEARVSDTKELVYKFKTYYIFNTQTPHMVSNLEGERFVFTLEFRDKVTYEDLVNFFMGEIL